MGQVTTGEQSSKSKSYQSSLANTQEEILKKREAFFQDYFIPEWKEVYEEFDPDSAASKAQMGLTAQEINTSFDSAQKQTDQMIAQRNLGKTGAGAALTAANNRAKSSALASAYANQMAGSTANKANALAQLGSTLMPGTTTAAPMQDESTSSGTQYGSWTSAII